MTRTKEDNERDREHEWLGKEIGGHMPGGATEQRQASMEKWRRRRYAKPTKSAPNERENYTKPSI